MSGKTTKQRRGFFPQFIVDFSLGLAMFGIVAYAGAHLPGGNRIAEAQPIFSSTAYAAAPHANWALSHAVEPTTLTGRPALGNDSTFILGLAFAAVFAFDMGLFRHLRRVYASPR